jgi:hypothetical protein
MHDIDDAHLLVVDRGGRGGRFIAEPDVAPKFRLLVETLRRIDPRVPRPLLTLPGLGAPLLPLYDALSHRLFGPLRDLERVLLAAPLLRSGVTTSSRPRGSVCSCKTSSNSGTGASPTR